MASLEERLKTEARRLGFDLVGIAPAVTPAGVESLREWLAKGHAGEMGYMTRHAEAREHPNSILPQVRSVIVAAMNYKTTTPPSTLPRRGEGKVSGYAWGDDYHEVLRDRLKQLLDWLRTQSPSCQGRATVDTAPLLERDFARLAGLGWFGKNTMLLNKRLGSYFFIGALLVNIELRADQPFETSHCGTCTACLDACPTQAFVGPGQLDARRCISYLTIELRGPIPRELREPMGQWLFGCDVCQDVCPWNRKAPATEEPAFQPRPELLPPNPRELLRLSKEAFRRRFKDSAILRAKRSGLLRNAAIALGNAGDPESAPTLLAALQDEEPIVRGAAAWALGKLGTEEARRALEKQLALETDEYVRDEIARTLE
jgi:epoxyqueuosine reductase